MERYDRWKARFPKDNYEYWDEQKRAIEMTYESDVEELLSSGTPIETISQFIEQLRRLIQYHITIESTVNMFGPWNGALVLRLRTAELLEPDMPEIKKELANLLFALKCMKSYGLPISTDMLTDERGTQISYTLALSSLMVLSSIIIKIQEYENNRKEMTDWDSRMFEMQYEEYLKNYNISIKDEIDRRYKSKK